MTHICVGNLNTIGPDNGLSPGRHQAIIWTNAGILLIEPWGTNFSEILIDIHTFSVNKIHLKMSSAKWRPFCLGLNVLTYSIHHDMYPINKNMSGNETVMEYVHFHKFPLPPIVYIIQIISFYSLFVPTLVVIKLNNWIGDAFMCLIFC